VAPPYPGAFTDIDGERLRILRTRVLDEDSPAAKPTLALDASGRLVARCGGGGTLLILDGDYRGAPLASAQLGAHGVPLGESA
jgi:methionyl-tRNA formyltransferase